MEQSILEISQDEESINVASVYLDKSENNANATSSNSNIFSQFAYKESQVGELEEENYNE